MKFKGWDYSEIATALKIKIPEEVKVDDVEFLREKLCSFMITFTEWNPKIVKVCREYLDALIKASGSGAARPILIGLSKVKDDYTFMHWFLNNLGSMWS